MNTLRGLNQLKTRLTTCSRAAAPLNRLFCDYPRVNKLENVQTAHLQKDNGAIYDKKPFKVELEKDKQYSWCLCGKSKSQPFCDGTHKNVHLKINLRPVRFVVPESGVYFLCNCKQTANRPFCDGTHKQEHIQSAIR